MLRLLRIPAVIVALSFLISVLVPNTSLLYAQTSPESMLEEDYDWCQDMLLNMHSAFAEAKERQKEVATANAFIKPAEELTLMAIEGIAHHAGLKFYIRGCVENPSLKRRFARIYNQYHSPDDQEQ